MNFIKKYIITVILICQTWFGFSQTNYYQSALGLNGTALKTKLHQIIKNHSDLGWPLWTYFPDCDTKSGNIVWDIYSDKPGGTVPYTFTFGNNQCGTYNSEADCFNHEHTWPSTYFGDAQPMRTDLFHVMPTDGFVNNKRSNFPYGKVTNANWTSDNGSKLGVTNSYTTFTSGNPNHWGFEPIDSFKGDVARNYFYMATRYYTEDAGWGTWEMASGADLSSDAIQLLLLWHHNDPVSQKEIDRNEAIYQLQGNRNPFIDYPQFADCIWGNDNCTALLVDQSNKQPYMQLYPNPAHNSLHISLPETEIRQIRIMNIMGQISNPIYRQQSNSLEIDIHDLPVGIYSIHIQMNNQLATQAFIKN